MTIAQSEIDQIAAALPGIRCRPEFDRPQWWLTFYLTGDGKRLESAADRLRACAAINLDDTETGFLYPKILVASELTAVVDAVGAVVEICEMTGVELLNVDVDTSPDVRVSNFATIYES